MEALQKKLQSLKMIKIKTYLETLLTNIKKENIYFASRNSIDKYKRDESWEKEIQDLIDLIGKKAETEAEEETLSDFFKKSENCKYFGLLFGFGLTYEAELDPHKIPNVYVDNSGLKPVVHIFPHFEDFHNVFESIGGDRIIKGIPPETSNKNNRNSRKNKGGKRKTRTRTKKTRKG
jgi:hypothetical protein